MLVFRGQEAPLRARHALECVQVDVKWALLAEGVALLPEVLELPLQGSVVETDDRGELVVHFDGQVAGPLRRHLAPDLLWDMGALDYRRLLEGWREDPDEWLEFPDGLEVLALSWS